MLISSILVLALHAAFRQTQYVINQTEKIEPLYRQSRQLTDLWREEFSGLYLPPSQQYDQESSIDRFQLSYQPGSTMRLSFFTLTPAWHQNAADAKPAKVCYHLKRNEQSETLTLSRTEQPHASQLPIALQNETTLARNLKSLSFTVYDSHQRQWQPIFQADQTLPHAIRVKFQFAQPTTRKGLEFSTTFFISPRQRANR